MKNGYNAETGDTYSPDHRLYITAGDIGIKIINYSVGGIRPAPRSGDFERSMGRSHTPMPWQVEQHAEQPETLSEEEPIN